MFYVVLAADGSNAASTKGLAFFRRPDEVHSTMKIAKGALVLAPVAPLQNFSCKGSSGAVSLGKHTMADESATEEFFVNSPGKPQISDTAPNHFPADSTVAAFWWVTTTDNAKEANMISSTVLKEGVKIPVLTNSCEIAPFTKLLKFKAKPKPAQPLQSATVLPDPGPLKKRGRHG